MDAADCVWGELSDDALVSEFHRVGLWTPEERAEVRARSAHLLRVYAPAGALQRFEHRLMDQLMHQRYLDERMGMWL